MFLGLLFFFQSFISVLIAIMLFGVAGAFWIPAEQAWIAKNVDPKERARSIGGYSTFRGLIAFPGPFIGGILFDAFGYQAPIGVNMVLAFADIFLLLMHNPTILRSIDTILSRLPNMLSTG